MAVGSTVGLFPSYFSTHSSRSHDGFDSLTTTAAASTRVVNYSSNFSLLEYSLISISGCKFPFPFPVAVFLQSIDELLEFTQTWGFAISFATCQP